MPWAIKACSQFPATFWQIILHWKSELYTVYKNITVLPLSNNNIIACSEILVLQWQAILTYDFSFVALKLF